MAYLRLSEVSAERRAFVRECQRIGFGEITGLLVRDSEPVFSDETAARRIRPKALNSINR
jgi:hypothetical protein